MRIIIPSGLMRFSSRISARSLASLSTVPLFTLLVSAGALCGPAWAAPFAYVSLQSADKVAVLDMATNTIVNEVLVGHAPQGIAVSPSGRFAYVANLFSHNVSIIDTEVNAVVGAFSPMSILGMPYGIAVHPDGSRLYVTNFAGDSLSVIDAASNLPVAQVLIPAPRTVTVNRAGTFAYVSQNTKIGPGTLAVVDLASNSVIASIPVNVTGSIVFSPDDTKAYVASANTVAVIDTVGRQQTASWVSTSSSPAIFYRSLALSSDGSRLYLVSDAERTLFIFDTATGSVLSQVTLGDASRPTDVAVDSASQRAIVTSVDTGTSDSVDLRTNQLIKSISIGSRPVMFGSVIVSASGQATESNSGGGGGGCFYLSDSGSPPDPTLPLLVATALVLLGMRARWPQR